MNTQDQKKPIPLSIELLQLGTAKLVQLKQTLEYEQRKNTKSLISAAYTIQNEIHKLRKIQGDRLIGYKVGCISETIQKSLKIHEPVFGRLYASECFDSGTTLPLSQFDNLAIEGELAVRLSSTVESNSDREFVSTDLVHSVFPVIELHHFAFDKSPTAVDLVALNAIHAGFVQNQEPASNKTFPEWLSISTNGSSLAEISGRVLFETVDKSLCWLARALARQGLQMRKNQIILCGSVADLFPLPQGGHIEASTDSCGTVECLVD